MINPYHLRYFVDAATLGSLSEAAKKNRVSQSAVSQAIRSLERTIGLPLTTHQKKILSLTDEGKAVLEQSEAVFQSLEQLMEATHHLKLIYAGPLTIGCTNTVALGVLPPLLSELGQRYPKINAQVRIGNSEVIKDWLVRKEVDVGVFVDDGHLSRELQKTILRTGHYVLFRRNKKAADSEGLVVTRSHRKEVQAILHQLHRNQRPAKVQCEITSWEAIKRYVLHAGGYGICPDYVIEKELRSAKLVALPLRKQNSYDLIAATRARRHLGKNAKLFLEWLNEGQRFINRL